MDIKLNFINNSNDANNSDIAIFQKNGASEAKDDVIAWKVIRNCDRGENHPFSFATDVQVASSDAWGNYTPRLTAEPGQQYTLATTASGEQLQRSGPSDNPEQIEVINALEQGAIGTHIFKSGKLLAKKTAIAPQQKAVFAFEPVIHVGVVSQMDEGDIMNAAERAEATTQFSLVGIASADIVMTGGGPGRAATAFQFQLENVVMA